MGVKKCSPPQSSDCEGLLFPPEHGKNAPLFSLAQENFIPSPVTLLKYGPLPGPVPFSPGEGTPFRSCGPSAGL